jgi:hypothetical protein
VTEGMEVLDKVSQGDKMLTVTWNNFIGVKTLNRAL